VSKGPGNGTLRSRMPAWTGRNPREVTWEINQDFCAMAAASRVRIPDLGSGDKPYQCYFPDAAEYIGVDLAAKRTAEAYERALLARGRRPAAASE